MRINSSFFKIISNTDCTNYPVVIFTLEQLAWIENIQALPFEVDIFAEPFYINHLYDNEGFEMRLPMNNGWVNTLNRYSQVLKTLHRVRDVIRVRKLNILKSNSPL